MNAPKIYRRSKPLTKYRESKERQERKEFYQGKHWRRLRSRNLKATIAKDIEGILDIYRENESMCIHELNMYLALEPVRPYCRGCIKEDRIQPAFVLDHIKPIKDGGAPLDETNLQWLCHHHHQSKSAKERGES